MAGKVKLTRPQFVPMCVGQCSNTWPVMANAALHEQQKGFREISAALSQQTGSGETGND